jgi:hypothetical protein
MEHVGAVYWGMRYEVRHGDELLATFDDREFAFGVADKIRDYGEAAGKFENIHVLEVEDPFSGAPMPDHPESENQSTSRCLLEETDGSTRFARAGSAANVPTGRMDTPANDSAAAISSKVFGKAAFPSVDASAGENGAVFEPLRNWPTPPESCEPVDAVTLDF